jgi:cysteinyl-tRNA synthetase
MTLQLYNTLTRKKELFVPVDNEHIRMYVCGPTVYDDIHIGNARPLVVFDVLYRLLKNRYRESEVSYIRNITDVDDKIIKRATENGESIDDLTVRNTFRFQAAASELCCLKPTVEPRATDHISQMINLIKVLIEKDHAYVTKDGEVLFSVPSMPDYGRLSRQNRDEMILGARIELSLNKRDPSDFVLWKPSTDNQPGWDSIWGRGRPGWHVECSAMSEDILGQTSIFMEEELI